MKTGVFAGGACRFTRSIPGRNHQAPGTGGEDTTGTVFPIGSSASASANAEPSVSPSASLWVTAVTTRALSITCQIRGASSEEHTSELQSHSDLVCRLLLEKKKKQPPREEELATRAQHPY